MWIYKVLMYLYSGYEPLNQNVDENAEQIQVDNMVSVGVQTDMINYTSFNFDTSHIEDINYEDSFFKHLAFVDQTYYEHFCDAIKYSWCSLRASFYFFIHAFWPDIYIKHGSTSIHELSDIIREKYTNRINELRHLSRNN